jgi:hypothetical protein
MRSLSFKTLWTYFVVSVLFVCTVGPAATVYFKTGTLSKEALINLIALATGLRLWFSQIPGAASIPCPTCAQAMAMLVAHPAGAAAIQAIAEHSGTIPTPDKVIASLHDNMQATPPPLPPRPE